MRQRYKIVTSIFLNRDLAKIREKIRRAKREGANCIELRGDSYPKISQEDLFKLRRISKELNIPTIFTLRAREEGGRYHFSVERKLNLIKKAIDLNFEYLDIELRFLEKLKKTVFDLKRNSKTKVILSHHNLKGAKDINELRKIKNKMLNLGADILKIAVFSKSKSTNQDILELIREAKREGRKFIGITMGKKGKEVRIKGLLEGNYFGYFSSNKKEETAPGQISLAELKKLMGRK
jgi:3-dehydroquinate dehydratase-1